MDKPLLKHSRFLFYLSLMSLASLTSSCEKDQWSTEYMATGAVMHISTNGKRTKNYEAKFYRGKMAVNSDIALGKAPAPKPLFRTQRGDDGRSENLWLPIDTITAVIVNNDNKSFSYKTFVTQRGKYTVLTRNFTNTVNCGCGHLYLEKWTEPLSY